MNASEGKGNFIIKDDRRVVIRAHYATDVEALLSIMNGLVEEDAPILATKPSSLEHEQQLFAQVEKGEIISLIAEVDGKVVGRCQLRKNTSRASHVGTLAMGVSRDS